MHAESEGPRRGRGPKKRLIAMDLRQLCGRPQIEFMGILRPKVAQPSPLQPTPRRPDGLRAEPAREMPESSAQDASGRIRETCSGGWTLTGTRLDNNSRSDDSLQQRTTGRRGPEGLAGLGGAAPIRSLPCIEDTAA